MTTRREFFAGMGICVAASAGIAAIDLAVDKGMPKTVEPSAPKLKGPALVKGDINMHVQLIRYSYRVDGREKPLQIELVVRDEMHEYVIEFCAEHPWTAPDWLQDRFIDITFKYREVSELQMYINGTYYGPCTGMHTLEEDPGLMDIEFHKDGGGFNIIHRVR
jgi:hypothetical protein